jgi:hypothetical protein
MNARHPSAVVIDAILGGPEYHEGATVRAFRQLSLAFDTKRGRALATRSGVVQIIFLAPGSISPDEGAGLIVGEWRRRRHVLVFRAFVPPELRWVRIPRRNEPVDPNEPSPSQQRAFQRFAFSRIREAVSVAAHWFRVNQLNYDDAATLRFVADVARECGPAGDGGPTLFD